jgi:hypothetical protein
MKHYRTQRQKRNQILNGAPANVLSQLKPRCTEEVIQAGVLGGSTAEMEVRYAGILTGGDSTREWLLARENAGILHAGKQQMIADKVEAGTHHITRKASCAQARKIWRQETKTTVMTAMARPPPCLPLNRYYVQEKGRTDVDTAG